MTKKISIVIILMVILVISNSVYSEDVLVCENKDIILSKGNIFKEDVFLLEQKYKTNHNNGSLNTEDNKAFKVTKGTVPILISAPHGVDNFREDIRKSHETYTGSIAEILSEEMGVYSIVKVFNDGIDDNYIMHTEYKKVIGDIIDENDILFFIDIHGMSSSNEVDIDLGTNLGYNLLEYDYYESEFKTIFLKNGIDRVGVNFNYSAMQPFTISNYVAHQYNIPSLQIEINKDYRKPGTDFDKFVDLMNGLYELIIFINDNM